MFNEEEKLLDLQFIAFKYRKSYIRRIAGSDDAMKFELALGARQQAIECLCPTLIDSCKYNSSKNCTNHKMKTLRASCLGVARLQLSKVDSIVQINDNIEFD